MMKITRDQAIGVTAGVFFLNGFSALWVVLNMVAHGAFIMPLVTIVGALSIPVAFYALVKKPFSVQLLYLFLFYFLVKFLILGFYQPGRIPDFNATTRLLGFDWRVLPRVLVYLICLVSLYITRNRDTES